MNTGYRTMNYKIFTPVISPKTAPDPTLAVEYFFANIRLEKNSLTMKKHTSLLLVPAGFEPLTVRLCVE